MRWRITIAIYRHVTDADSSRPRPEDRYFYVYAADFMEALKMAQCYAEGVGSHRDGIALIEGVHRHDPIKPTLPGA